MEGKDYSNGRKHREEAQLVTPQNPQYLYGFSKSNANLDVVGPAISGERPGAQPSDVLDQRMQWLAGMPSYAVEIPLGQRCTCLRALKLTAAPASASSCAGFDPIRMNGVCEVG